MHGLESPHLRSGLGGARGAGSSTAWSGRSHRSKAAASTTTAPVAPHSTGWAGKPATYTDETAHPELARAELAAPGSPHRRERALAQAGRVRTPPRPLHQV